MGFKTGMSNTLQIRSQVWYYSIKLDTSWVARRAWVDIWSISNISGSTTATTKTKTSLDAQRIVLSNDTMKSPESNSKIVYRNHFHFFLDTLYLRFLFYSLKIACQYQYTFIKIQIEASLQLFKKLLQY